MPNWRLAAVQAVTGWQAAGWQNLQKEIFDSAYSEESYDSAVEVPEYEGEPYVILDGNEPAFTEDEMTTTVYEQYSPLDSYGRCQTAEACVEKTDADEKRGDISECKADGMAVCSV